MSDPAGGSDPAGEPAGAGDPAGAGEPAGLARSEGALPGAMGAELAGRLAPLVLLTGMCPLIPIPLLDDYVERELLRAAIRRIAVTEGRAIPEETIITLVEDRSSFLVGCLWAIVRWPFKKLFRTIFFFLAAKDIVDVVSRNSHRVAIFHLALRRDLLPAHAARVREDMDATLDRVSISPLTRTVLRYEKLPAEAWQRHDTLPAQIVASAHRRGGGGVVLEKFLERVSAFSAP